MCTCSCIDAVAKPEIPPPIIRGWIGGELVSFESVVGVLLSVSLLWRRAVVVLRNLLGSVFLFPGTVTYAEDLERREKLRVKYLVGIILLCLNCYLISCIEDDK